MCNLVCSSFGRISLSHCAVYLVLIACARVIMALWRPLERHVCSLSSTLGGVGCLTYSSAQWRTCVLSCELVNASVRVCFLDMVALISAFVLFVLVMVLASCSSPAFLCARSGCEVSLG